MIPLINEQKRRKLLELLDQGVVMLHLVPSAEGARVPPEFSGDAVLRLNIAYGFRLPGLEIDDEGVYAVLSFNRRDFPCWLPWDSIFGMTLPETAHEGVVWPDSLPDDLLPFFEGAGASGGEVAVSLRAVEGPPTRSEGPRNLSEGPPAPTPRTARKKARPMLAVHPGGQDDAARRPEPSPTAKKPARSHLRLVKD